MVRREYEPLLLAMIYSLSESNQLTFKTDYETIGKKFDILFRNGFLQQAKITFPEESLESAVKIQAFNPADKEGYAVYIEKRLLRHKGLPEGLDKKLKAKIFEDLLEVFCNTNHHANTGEPFFVGSQYYPKQGCLKYTMVDLSDGFFCCGYFSTADKFIAEID